MLKGAEGCVLGGSWKDDRWCNTHWFMVQELKKRLKKNLKKKRAGNIVF